ncbi:hypothetical protein, partial [Acidithiobacillus sp. HP-11]|uniref:hypothetical protein n=1 Tax=Acidithiobacillus sp. HP-11 TaxID=2697656 RepID=UPI001D0CE5C6
PPTTAEPILTREKTALQGPSANSYSGHDRSTAFYPLPTQSDEEPKIAILSFAFAPCDFSAIADFFYGYSHEKFYQGSG